MNLTEYRAVAHRMANRRTRGTPHGDLVKAIIQRLLLVPRCFAIQMNTGALRAVGQGGKERLVRYGFPGMADVYVRLQGPGLCWLTLWVEAKVPPDTQSDGQLAFQRMATEWGDQYFVVTAIEQVGEILRQVRP